MRFSLPAQVCLPSVCAALFESSVWLIVQDKWPSSLLIFDLTIMPLTIAGRRAGTLAAAAACALLAGCSSLQTLFHDPLTPEGDVTEVMTLTGRGVQQFQCVKDSKGYYWKFVAPKVSLVEKGGKEVAVQGADFVFVAPDGSVLSSKIVKWDEKPDEVNVRSVLFQTSSHGPSGVLTGVHWVKRNQAKGGMPNKTCAAASRGELLQVPFTARYTFYR